MKPPSVTVRGLSTAGSYVTATVMPDRRVALLTVIGTLYGPPPTRNGVSGGVTMICACPIPALVTGTSGVDVDAAALTGAVPDAAGAGGGTAAGAGAAEAPPGGGGGAGAGCGGVGVTTNPGTGDVPGGTCNVGGAGGGGCTPTPGVTGSAAMRGGG